MVPKYPPPYHQINDRNKMIAVIKAFPLGMLVSSLNDEPLITHIPIIFDKTETKLVAHIDRSNPQVKSLVHGAVVKVVFKGPDTYISPSVYSTEQLPTWNYIIVHITGTIRLINDAEAAKETMIRMTRFLEGDEQRFVLEKDDKRMHRMINYIQAFDINITNWEGKFKLSQDKISVDFESAKQQLLKTSRVSDAQFIEQMYTEISSAPDEQ